MAYLTDATVNITSIVHPLLLWVTTEHTPAFDGRAVLQVRGGAFCAQVYPSAKDCRDLSDAFAAAAESLELTASTLEVA